LRRIADAKNENFMAFKGLDDEGLGDDNAPGLEIDSDNGSNETT
jgi:hypothetical protein